MSVNRDKRPVTEDDFQAVRRLAKQGLGRNAIARELKRSPRTISEIAAKLDPPVTFDRTMTAVATQARVIDAKARRAALMDRYYEQAHKALDRLDQDEHEITEVSIGKVVRYRADVLPTQDVRNLVQASAAAANQAAKLEAMDAGSGHEEDRGILAGIAQALGWKTPGGSGEG